MDTNSEHAHHPDAGTSLRFPVVTSLSRKSNAEPRQAHEHDHRTLYDVMTTASTTEIQRDPYYDVISQWQHMKSILAQSALMSFVLHHKVRFCEL